VKARPKYDKVLTVKMYKRDWQLQAAGIIYNNFLIFTYDCKACGGLCPMNWMCSTK
jgi:hypothetical protein